MFEHVAHFVSQIARHFGQPLFGLVPQHRGERLGGLPLDNERVPAALQLSPHGLNRVRDTARLQDILGDVQGLDEPVALQASEVLDERLQVTAVRGFERVDVLRPLPIPDHQGEPAGFDEHQRTQRPGDSPVAILERVNLREPVMQPSCLDLRRHVVVPVMQGDQPVHFRVHLLRRAVLVDGAIRPQGVVGQPLVCAPDERDRRSPAEGVPMPSTVA